MRFLKILRNDKNSGVAIPLSEIDNIEKYDDKVCVWVKSGHSYPVMMHFDLLIELLTLDHQLIIKCFEAERRKIPLPKET